jgi:hypothetical protein
MLVVVAAHSDHERRGDAGNVAAAAILMGDLYDKNKKWKRMEQIGRLLYR